jgi:hypothetical protein
MSQFFSYGSKPDGAPTADDINGNCARRDIDKTCVQFEMHTAIQRSSVTGIDANYKLRFYIGRFKPFRPAE